MPFKSEAQKRKFAKLVSDGKMSQETYNKWDKETTEKLPEKIGQSNNQKQQVRSVDDIREQYRKRFGK